MGFKGVVSEKGVGQASYESEVSVRDRVQISIGHLLSVLRNAPGTDLLWIDYWNGDRPNGFNRAWRKGDADQFGYFA